MADPRLALALAEMFIDGNQVNWESCVAFERRTLNSIKRHWLSVSLRVVFFYFRQMLWRGWSRYQDWFLFRWIRGLFMSFHVILQKLCPYVPAWRETRSKNAGTGKAKTRKPASFRKHQRRKSSRKFYGMVEPVIGESARPRPQ